MKNIYNFWCFITDDWWVNFDKVWKWRKKFLGHTDQGECRLVC